MIKLSKIKNVVRAIGLLCLFPQLVFANTELVCKNTPTIIQRPIIFNEERIALTQAYRWKHYGIQSKSISITPKMIVLHWTAVPSLEESLTYFQEPTLDERRSELGKPGDLNVSTHFIVDRDGTIYQLMPETWMARHVIGLNPIAIGIENVGGANGREDLTEQQIAANADLVCLLKQRYPSIQYLIGHFEYAQFRHTSLWQEKDKSYYTQKSDPGPQFMEAVRKRVGKLGLLPIQ